MALSLCLGAIVVSVACLTPTSAYYYGGLPKAQPVGRPRLCLQDKDYCFSYDRSADIGPPRWFLVCDTEKCFGGLNQSPIAIDPYYVSCECDPYHRLGYNPVNVVGMLENDGYYPKIASETHDLNRAVLRGVPGRDDDYLLDSIHIHFGRRGGKRGSEHVIRGKRYDGEMHMVHKHKRANNGGSDEEAGQAVVGVLLSTKEGEWNKELHHILDRLWEIEAYESDPCNDTFCDNGMMTRSMKMMCPHWMSGNGNCGGKYISVTPEWLLPDSRDFYYYYGSLTTPTLSESVLWHVMKTPLRITYGQLELLRRLESRFEDHYGGKIPISVHGNLRPLQKQNGRTIHGNICH